MRRLIAVLCIASVLAGCASIRPVDPRSAGGLGEVNADLDGRVALVRLADGTEILAHDVSVSETSVTFRRERFPDAVFDWPALKVEEIPTSEVDTIELNRKGIGGLQGLLLGLGGGAGIGAALGQTVFESQGSLATLSGAVVFGVLGAAVGVLIGGSVGAAQVYEMTGVDQPRPVEVSESEAEARSWIAE
jgi:hypothetical protein